MNVDDDRSRHSRSLRIAAWLLGALAIIFVAGIAVNAWLLPVNRSVATNTNQPVYRWGAGQIEALHRNVKDLAGTDGSALAEDRFLTTKLANETAVAATPVEVCGLGKVKLNEYGVPAQKLDEEIIQARLVEIGGEFTQSKIEIERALGLYISARAQSSLAGLQASKDASCANLPGGGCYDKAKPAVDAALIAAAAPLLDMARTTSDPAIYTSALRTCRWSTSEACKEISANRLLTIDPENMQSWLYVAEAAKRENDKLGEERALQRASEQQFYAERRLPVHRVLTALQARDEAPLVVNNVSAQMLAFEFNVTPSMPTVFQSFCKKPALDLEGRMEACKSLAIKMETGAESIMAESFSNTLHTRTGRSEDESKRREEDRNAILYYMLSDEARGDFYSCSSLVNQNNFLQESLEKGDRNAVRDRLKARGLTLEQWLNSVNEAKRKGTYKIDLPF